MTHVVRPAALAAALDPLEWDVHIWTPKRYHALVSSIAAEVGNLHTIDPNAFLDALARGGVLYAADTLHHYVQQDVEILDRVRPDLVIGDYRLSLAISAPLRAVPFVSIFNAHWSPYRRQPAVVPEMPLTRWIAPRLLGPLYALLRPAFYAWHAKPVNQVRRAYGLAPLSPDLRRIYTAGDLVLYPDVPEYAPVAGAPAHHHFVGACRWSMPIAHPLWWDDVMSSPRRKVFVSLGSSGPVKALPAVLDALSPLGVEIIVSTSGRAVGTVPPNVHVADLLPYEETARHSAIVVSHGGTGGVYPALSAGTPLLVIPSNIDMQLSAARLESTGAGLQIRIEYASPARLRHAAERLLADPRFKQAAVRWSGLIARYDTKTIFPTVLREWFAHTGRPQGTPA